MITLDELHQRIQQTNEWFDDKSSSLSDAPQGYVKYRNVGGKTYYTYCRKEGEAETVRHLKVNSAEDQTLARAVAQKSYDRQVLRRAAAERDALMALEKVYRDGKVEDIYEKMPAERRRLVTPVSLTDDEYASAWQNQPFSVNPIPEDIQTFETERGELVRSKSEVFIANALLRHKIPYFFEYPVRVVDHLTHWSYTLHPDFYVLNTRTRRAYFWEHLGLMEKADYYTANAERLIDYDNAGFYPGKNMILTYETKSSPFTPKYADRVIKKFLL